MWYLEHSPGIIPLELNGFNFGTIRSDIMFVQRGKRDVSTSGKRNKLNRVKKLRNNIEEKPFDLD